ncbi:bifunctional glutamate N-acetyltransferase/amino-acid acetyltransferase ArgJ [Actinobaculum sp. 313]|uniref:bifunctional glutamate N-acetyltransferase/amino-acid acetyltransferase ArgJ n=1 Tax=Actinobaculum sp. 313 TaxID=2495645 RepID=UPI000D526D07|nr:bifunctional glutamate N-acetyltransferase/amino-acid acetyltransferase ArgJ [Actinobaculum sp. 313]AWE42463.1 bifunctional ornithine acetyltransferase/N-acetylglutamate synthase [Actinobaculum sp. 313]
MTVTAAKGFRAAGVAGGLKEDGREDIAVVVNDGPEYSAAAVTTSNRVYAAPVAWTRSAVSDGSLRAVVLNSGGANACTGEAGYADAVATAHLVARSLDVAAADVAVCSTGLIGQRLDMRAIRRGVGMALEALTDEGGKAAARAILTTDTVPKTAALTGDFTIGGMAKGAGMLAPQLATMLVVITTDASVSRETAQLALDAAVEMSFNRIDSDGCMSTNDTVILLANGASGYRPEPEEFTAALTRVAQDLAAQLIGDAEGASHDIAIEVTGASSQDAGLAVARAVARSNLLKAAIFGNDPNWGRVLASMGTVPQASAPFDPDAVDVIINGVTVCRNGGIGDPRENVNMDDRLVTIGIDLKAGAESVRVLTNDLTYDYVTENSAYSS